MEQKDGIDGLKIRDLVEKVGGPDEGVSQS